MLYPHLACSRGVVLNQHVCEEVQKGCVESRRGQFTAEETHRTLCSFLYRLDQALAQYFGEAAEIVEQEEVYPATPAAVRKCPQCNNDMVLKTKKSGGWVIFCVAESSLLC